jgi:hypothetical protein
MTEEPNGEPAEAPAADAPSEEELRARLDEELRALRVEDVILQSVASIVNLTARRIAKPDERDLEQGRIGIEAVRALLPQLPAEVQEQIRSALSELQMLYAREAGGGAAATGEGAAQPATEQARRPGPAEPSTTPGGRQAPPKLWTPPGVG